jgi:hypothetical protein
MSAGQSDHVRPDLGAPGAPLDRGVLARMGHEHRIAELEHEVATLRHALDSRTTIAVATGLLAERYGCSSSRAWALLTRVSSHTNVKVRDVARVLVAQADGVLEPDDAQVLVRLAAHLPGLGPTGEKAPAG